MKIERLDLEEINKYKDERQWLACINAWEKINEIIDAFNLKYEAPYIYSCSECGFMNSAFNKKCEQCRGDINWELKTIHHFKKDEEKEDPNTLKNCPFCGSCGKINNRSVGFSPECCNKECCAGDIDSHYMQYKDAISAWNTRK